MELLCAKFFNSSRKVKCLWPLNRMDKRTLEEESQIMGVNIINQHVVRAAGLSVRTRQQTLDEYVAADEDATV